MSYSELHTEDLSLPQPPPVPNTHVRVVDVVKADLDDRLAMGLAKYGTPLQPFNGRRALVDAYQEALDLCLYLRQLLLEEEEDDLGVDVSDHASGFDRAEWEQAVGRPVRYCRRLDELQDYLVSMDERGRAHSVPVDMELLVKAKVYPEVKAEIVRKLRGEA